MATVRVYVKLKYEGQTPAFYDISHRVNYENLTWESNSEGTSANANIPVWTILPKSQTTISGYPGATFTDRLNAAILDESFLIEIPNRAEVRIIDTSTNPDTVLFAGIITRVSSQREGSTIVQDIECADNTAILEEHIVADYYAPRDSRDIDIIYGGTTTYTSAASLPQLVGQIDGLSVLSESTGGSLSDGTYEVRAQARSSTLIGRDGLAPQYGPVTKISSIQLTAGTNTQKLKIKWKSPGSADSVRVYVKKTAGTGFSSTEYLAKTVNVLTSSKVITAATRTSNVIEITTQTAHGLSVGDPIIVTIPQTPGFSVGQEDFAIITSVPTATKLRYAKPGDDGSASATNAVLTSGGAAIIQSYSTVESPTVLTPSSQRGWADGEIYTVAGANWRLGIGPNNARAWLYPISVFGGLFDSSWVTDIGLDISTYVEAVDTQYRFSPYFQESDTPNAEQYGGRTVRQILDYISEKTGAEYWVDKGSIDGSGNYSTRLHYGAKTPKELVVNGLYDGNLNGWTTASGFTLQSSTSGPYGAGYSVLSSTPDTTITTDEASRPATSSGKKYFFSVRGKVSEHQNRLGAYVLWYNSSGTQIHSDHLGNIPGDPVQTWHRIWKIIEAPANAAYFGLQGQCTSSQHGSASFTDWSAIELTGSLGYGEFENTTGYAVPIYEMEIPTSPVESGNTANRLHLYAVFRTKDSSGNKVALTDVNGNPVQYVDYDFVPGRWATNGKIVEAAITDDRVETLADAELSAAGYWKENGLPIESYTFEMRPWDANGTEYPVPEVGQIIPFIWETLGVAKPLIVKSVAAKMVGVDVVYTITVGGDVRLQRSAFIRLSEKIKELEAVNPVPDIPDSPASLTVSSNDKMISLSWSFDQEKEINKKLTAFEVQRQDAIFKAISEISRSGSTVTVTTSAAHGLVNGDTIRIDISTTQTNLSGLEGQWTVSSTTTTSFTYACVESGTISTVEVDGYVYYNFTEFRTVQNTKATYVNDSGLIPSLQYRYQVRSLSSDLTASEFSEVTEPVSPNETTATVSDGAITSAKLASNLRAIEIISGDNLPSLPSASYPEGAVVYHLGGTPPGLRRVAVGGGSWQNAIGETDIVANSITTGLISAAGLDAAVVKSGQLLIDGRFGANAGTINLSYKYQTGTTATLWSSTAHGYANSDNLFISGVDANINGARTVSSITLPVSRKAREGTNAAISLDRPHVIQAGDSITLAGVDAVLNGSGIAVTHTDISISHKAKWGNKVALRSENYHPFPVSESISISGADTNANGTFAITGITPVASEKAQGSPVASGTNTSPTTGSSTTATIRTTDPNAFIVGDTVVVANSGTTAMNGSKTVASLGFEVSHYARSGTNVAIRTNQYHTIDTSDQILVSGLGAPYDGTFTVSAVSAPVIRTQNFVKTYQPTVVSTSSANFGTTATGGTINMPAGLIQGDLVLVSVGSSGTLSANISTSSTGWTKIVSNTSSTNVGHAIFSKIMGATPDTSFVVTGLTSSGATAVATGIRVPGGTISTTITTPTTAQQTSTSGGMPNPAAITTTLNDALIVIAAALDRDSITGVTAPAGYSNLVAQEVVGAGTNATGGHTGMMASRQLATAAAEDAAAFGGTGNDSWSAATIAVYASDDPVSTITSSSPIAFNVGDYIEITGTTATYNGGKKIYANSAPVTFKTQSATTATIETLYPHGFVNGDLVTVSGVGAPFDVTNATVSGVATTGNPLTFQYTVGTSATVARTAASGSASSSKATYLYSSSTSTDAIQVRTGTASSYSTINYTVGTSGENQISAVSPVGSVRNGRSFSFTATSASIIPAAISGTADNYRNINYTHGTTDSTPTPITALSPAGSATSGKTLRFTTGSSGDIIPQSASGTATNGKVFTVTATSATSALTALTGATSQKKTDIFAIKSTNFSVDYNGNITATGANISGAITASSGTIGGFTINSDSLTAGSGTNTVGLAPATYPFYAGNATASSAPFRVTPDGAVTSSNMSITGGPSGGNVLSVGGNVSIDSSGWINANTGKFNPSGSGKPALLLLGDGTQGDIAVPSSGTLQIGSTSATQTSNGTFALKLKIDTANDLITSSIPMTVGGTLTVTTGGASIAGGLSGGGGITFTGASTIANVDIETGNVNAGDGFIKTLTGITQTGGINFVNSRTGAIQGSHRYSTTASQGHYFTGIEAVGTVVAYWSASATSAYLGRSSSSIRYKENITPVDFDIDDIVALSPVTFTIKEQYRQRDDEGNIKPAEVLLGMIAEHGYGNPAWEKLVVFSEDTGEIDSWAYQHMGVVLLSAVRQLYQKTKDLEARIAELES